MGGMIVLDNHSRRTILVGMEPADLMSLMGNWRHEDFVALPVMMDAESFDGNRLDIPKDAVIEAVAHEWDRNLISFKLSHHSFAIVPEGEIPPRYYLRSITVEGIRTAQPGVIEGIVLVDSRGA